MLLAKGEFFVSIALQARIVEAKRFSRPFLLPLLPMLRTYMSQDRIGAPRMAHMA